MSTHTDSLEFFIGATSPIGAKREDELDLATAPDYQLFFSCFMGDVRLQIGGVDFSTRFGWVATLSFAIGFALRVSELPRTIRSGIDFQESSDRINLLLDGDRVHVSASYVKGIGVIPYERLHRISQQALFGLVDRLFIEYPALKRNNTLRNLLDSTSRG